MEETEVKKKILKAAESLFMKYGVRSISMDDIARHLAVSKKTLYQHFADKEDIVTMTCQAHIEEMSQSYEKPSEVVRWYLGDRQRMAEVEAVVVENNVAEFVLSKANVTDKVLPFDELMTS